MEYPNNFETPAFPAGRQIAVSRTIGIWTLGVFLVIIFLCAVLIWTNRSRTMNPVIIFDDWTATVVNSSESADYSVARAMQESVVGNFTRNWLRISDKETENDVRWCRGERAACPGLREEADGKVCILFCASGEELYTRFDREVLPDYMARVSAGETWSVDKKSISIKPLSQDFEKGGSWQIRAKVNSSLYGNFWIEAFAKIERKPETYPRTLGFYVADFNVFEGI